MAPIMASHKSREGLALGVCLHSDHLLVKYQTRIAGARIVDGMIILVDDGTARSNFFVEVNVAADAERQHGVHAVKIGNAHIAAVARATDPLLIPSECGCGGRGPSAARNSLPSSPSFAWGGGPDFGANALGAVDARVSASQFLSHGLGGE